MAINANDKLGLGAQRHNLKVNILASLKVF